MDKVSLLCEWDKSLLREFSARVTQRFTGRSLRAFPVPFIGEYLDSNVQKEVEKDRIIIERAAAAWTKRADLDIDRVFEETKFVDRGFTRHLLIPSLSVTVRYDDIADTRKERIALLSGMVRDLLNADGDPGCFEWMVRKTYQEPQFRELLTRILHLYNLETRSLSGSIRFLNPFGLAVHALAEMLFDAMETIAHKLVDESVEKIYHGAAVHV